MNKRKDSTGIFKATIAMKTDLSYLLLAKDAGDALERVEETDASEFEEESCTWAITSIEELTHAEVQADKRHTVHLKPTQWQMHQKAVRLSGEINSTFMDMIKGKNAITKTELRALIEKRPELWSRFSAFLDTDALEEK